jgi:uncharacterized protein (DUF1015 family)
VAEIIPFRGFRYDLATVKDLDLVVTQPYDRISDADQRVYYDRSPYNLVRAEKGKAEPGDNGKNVYTRAGASLAEWIKEGVLRRDELPSLYVYHQEYGFAGQRLVRKGVIVLGKLEPEKVHAHERTLKGPKEDRLRLMRATEANFGHIFMLYSDPARRADQALETAIAGKPPTMEARDDFGNRHVVWQVTDTGTIALVASALSDKDLYIADGHHRYETAITFMRECEAKGWRPAAPESFNARLMTLFNIDSPGMTIRPWHRLVHGIVAFDAKEFLGRAEKDFSVAPQASLEPLKKALLAGRSRHAFGFYARGACATLTLRDARLMDQLLSGGQSSDWKRLDVSILHTAILERYLGIDAKALEEERNVTYTGDPEDAVAQVNAGQEQALFLVNPTSPDEVRRVADHGEKMPQKSTDFYPKLLSGLVIHKMEIAK